MTTTPPRLPVPGEFVRHHGTLVSTDQKPPVIPPLEYIFEEISARIEMRLGDSVLKNLGEYNDFYGLDTSVKAAIEDAKKYAKKYKITPTSDLQMFVVRIVSCYRATAINGFNFYDETFRDFRRLDHGSEHKVPEAIESEAWSSKEER